MIDRVRETIFVIFEEIKRYTRAERQSDQIRRRGINGEKISHSEKVFSIFEEHTEWISKHKVCVVKDRFDFILHHRVMQNETDDAVAVPIILEAKERFGNVSSCSFNKGFNNSTVESYINALKNNSLCHFWIMVLKD